jgi:hypothetical protein
VVGRIEDETLRYAQDHAGETCADVPRQIRPLVRNLIVTKLQADLGIGSSWARTISLESMLFDQFGALNLDWRIVAQAELSECYLQGFIAAVGVGRRVRRMEPRAGSCPSCSNLNDQVFLVVAEDAPKKDWFAEVWRGKSRVRIGALSDAPAGDWPAAGLQHNGCRGSWVTVTAYRPEVSQGFKDWLEAAIAKAASGTTRRPPAGPQSGPTAPSHLRSDVTHLTDK